jgi:hypothetical protein
MPKAGLTHREKMAELRAIMPSFQPEADVVAGIVNDLIKALYKPVKDDRLTILDTVRARKFKVNFDEPVNWGGLCCADVKRFDDGSFLVTVEEASPDGCATLCAYISSHLEAYGYKAIVRTEW